MKDLVEFIVKSLADQPDQVEVREVADGRTVRVEIRVAEEDVGKVIGRQGRMINAIRTLAKAAAVQKGQKVFVEIAD